ncbi:hypothetical protein ACV3VX_12705 [Clostridium perfringens]
MKINHKITSIVLTLGLISSSIYTINVNAETLNSKIQVSNLNLSNSYNIKNENLIKSSKEGWINTNGIWYFYKNGIMQTGWLNDNGTWYYLNSSGEMVTNTIIDGWKIDSNGIATPLKDENHSIVYVTPNGKSYHYSKDCTALKRSSSILGMSLNEAINKGKSDPCNLCVK